MNAPMIRNNPYEQCLANSRKVNWDIDSDVVRFRTLDVRKKFLPDSLSRANTLLFLSADEQRLMSQIQGRTYAYMFGLVERFINAKVLELGHQHALGDQHALGAMVQFSQEEMKHQELFRRLDVLAAEVLPEGYTMAADPDAVAEVVLGKSAWAVLALICHIEVFVQEHYLASIRDAEGLCPLFKDVFRYHWMEEAQHVTLDELEWQRLHRQLNARQVEEGVYDLIELVSAVDGILQTQAGLDTAYFQSACQRDLNPAEKAAVHTGFLKAYRWQYIVSGVQNKRFQRALSSKLSGAQLDHVFSALTPLVSYVD